MKLTCVACSFIIPFCPQVLLYQRIKLYQSKFCCMPIYNSIFSLAGPNFFVNLATQIFNPVARSVLTIHRSRLFEILCCTKIYTSGDTRQSVLFSLLALVKRPNREEYIPLECIFLENKMISDIVTSKLSFSKQSCQSAC